MCFANLIKNGGCGNGTFIPQPYLSRIRGNLKDLTGELIILPRQQLPFCTVHIPSLV